VPVSWSPFLLSICEQRTSGNDMLLIAAEKCQDVLVSHKHFILVQITISCADKQTYIRTDRQVWATV